MQELGAGRLTPVEAYSAGLLTVIINCDGIEGPLLAIEPQNPEMLGWRHDVEHWREIEDIGHKLSDCHVVIVDPHDGMPIGEDAPSVFEPRSDMPQVSYGVKDLKCAGRAPVDGSG